MDFLNSGGATLTPRLMGLDNKGSQMNRLFCLRTSGAGSSLREENLATSALTIPFIKSAVSEGYCGGRDLGDR